MKRINLVIMTAVIAFSTLVFAAFALFGGIADMSSAQKHETVELYAACLTESVMFAVIGEYIFGRE
ncbi:MAG: hypothetical protein J5760_05135 [Clostridia bacterium]|nr:hypothetical protein [Clostridia bacterium]